TVHVVSDPCTVLSTEIEVGDPSYSVFTGQVGGTERGRPLFLRTVARLRFGVEEDEDEDKCCWFNGAVGPGEEDAPVLCTNVGDVAGEMDEPANEDEVEDAMR
ncbi:hypothetical protein BGZ83_001726, partial [Gryganskiella cystojenkinii]